MFKKITLLITMLFLMISCYNCSNEVDKNQLPTFQGINVDINTIFLVNSKDDNVHKIYAIDTKNNRKIYTYEFKKKIIYDLIFDASFDLNPYIILLSGEAFKIDVKSGKLKIFDVKYTPEVLSVIDNKLWITPSGVGFKNTPKDYFTYDVINDKSEYISIPEGLFWGSWMNIDNNYYLPLEYNAENPQIYNLNSGKILKDVITNSGEKYVAYNFYNNKYLYGWYLNNNGKLIGDFYLINSFEPNVSYKYLFTTDENYPFSGDLYENNNYLYFVNRHYIITRNKITYSMEKIIKLNNTISFGSYCKNGYIWLTSEENDGAYKVNMDDLSYEVVK